jgi:hypothetical protein
VTGDLPRTPSGKASRDHEGLMRPRNDAAGKDVLNGDWTREHLREFDAPGRRATQLSPATCLLGPLRPESRSTLLMSKE